MEEPVSPQIPSWLAWAIMNGQKRQPTFLGHIVLVLVLLSLVGIAYYVLLLVSSQWEQKWITAPQRLTKEQIALQTAWLKPKPSVQSRLIFQLQDVEVLIDRNASIMGFFYKQYYISLAMMCTLGAIAVICLFFISKEGWGEVNNAVINIFVVSSGVVLFYGNLSLTFKQEENIKNSHAIYLSCLSLRNELLSYLATRQNTRGVEEKPESFIHYVDKKLMSISLIQLGFNPGQLSDVPKPINTLSTPAITPKSP